MWPSTITEQAFKMHFSPPVSNIVLILFCINLTEMQEKHTEKYFRDSSQFCDSLLGVHWRPNQTTMPYVGTNIQWTLTMTRVTDDHTAKRSGNSPGETSAWLQAQQDKWVTYSHYYFLGTLHIVIAKLQCSNFSSLLNRLKTNIQQQKVNG